MDEDKKKRLQDKGYTIGDAEDFLDMTPDEVDKLLTMIEEARARWLIDKYSL